MDYVLIALMVVFVFYVFRRLVNGLQNHAYFQKTSLASFKCSLLNMHYIILKSAYRRTDTSAQLTFIFQSISGMCKIFSREKIFQMFLFFTPVVVLFKAEAVEEVLKSTETLKKPKLYKFLKPLIGSSLVLSEGQEWRHQRKYLTPSFHFNALETFLPAFHKHSMLFVDKLKHNSGTPWIDVVPMVKSCSLDIMCQITMGVELSSHGDDYKEYVQALKKVVDMVFHRIAKPWQHPDWIFYILPSGRCFKRNLQVIFKFIDKVMAEGKLKIVQTAGTSANTENAVDSSSGLKEKRSLLDAMLKLHLQDRSVTEDNIKAQINALMLVGHDVTAMAMCWTLYMIGLHESVQNKIHEELDDIFEDDTTKEITSHELGKMKYLECVIKETLRLYPVLPIFLRYVDKEIEIFNHRVVKGSICLILTTSLHRDPEYFPDPEKFIPERFFLENSIGRHPYAYIPFSAGPRNCLAQKFAYMEIKTLLSNVMRRFSVTSLDHRDKVNVTMSPELKNVEPLRLKFTLRQPFQG